jgi:hypothetical protein
MLILFGVSFRTAPMAVRETLSEVEALALRRAAVPEVETMVDQAVVGWMRRRAQRCLSGAIRRRPLRRLLHELVSELRTTEAGAA